MVSIIYFNSSSVTEGCFFSPLNRLINPCCIFKNRNETGVSTVIKASSTPHTPNATFSLCSFAKVFGNISPKINTTIVTTTVETQVPAFPIQEVNSTAAMEDIAMFTKLLPIKMLERVFSYISAIFKAIAAFLSPASA